MRRQNWKVTVRKEKDPFLARILIEQEWDQDPRAAQKLLDEICSKWPASEKVKFLLTCGGFVLFDWPHDITRKNIGDVMSPNKDALKALIKEAEECVKSILADGLEKKLSKHVDYITVGVDSYLECYDTNKPHIELVCFVDLKTSSFYWTGKSYPVYLQQKGLVRISNLKTHFLNLTNYGKLMILGCHDLSIFNPRSITAKGWRKEVNNEFRKLATLEKPICVLQHPHTTVKKRTWLSAWCGLRTVVPSVKQYAGSGIYYEPSEPGNRKSSWDSLRDVRQNTKYGGNTLDFIVKEKREK